MKHFESWCQVPTERTWLRAPEAVPRQPAAECDSQRLVCIAHSGSLALGAGSRALPARRLHSLERGGGFLLLYLFIFLSPEWFLDDGFGSLMSALVM